jgi:transcriptional regulator with XRE-family HTH domain
MSTKIDVALDVQFADWLREEMIVMNLTQTAVVELTGVSSGGLRTILSGSHSPSLATVDRIVRGLANTARLTVQPW